MRVLISQGGKAKLQLNGDRMMLEAPKNGMPLALEAEMDDLSLVKIVIDGRPPIPVRGVKLINRKTYRVDGFVYIRNRKRIEVKGHDRRMPVTGPLRKTRGRQTE